MAPTATDENGTVPMTSSQANDATASDTTAAAVAQLAISSHNRIHVLPGASDTAASFEFEDEDHTLGNALRYIIMKNPDVELCGYSIPHPSEPKMNLRIQTYDNVNVYAVLEKAFNDLIDLCNVVTEKFTEARADFEENRMQE